MGERGGWRERERERQRERKDNDVTFEIVSSQLPSDLERTLIILISEYLEKRCCCYRIQTWDSCVQDKGSNLSSFSDCLISVLQIIIAVLTSPGPTYRCYPTPEHWSLRAVDCLTLSQTSPGFYVSAVQVL